MTEIIPLSWYDDLISDCKAAIIETEFSARQSIIEGYHSVGVMILERSGEIEDAKMEMGSVCAAIAQALNKSVRSIQYAVQFAKAIPSLEQMPKQLEGKDVSWHRICHELLDGGEKKSIRGKKQVECPYCQRRFVP